MNGGAKGIPGRLSPPGRCHQPFRRACRCAAILLLVGAVTLPSMVFAKLGPSPEAISMAVVFYTSFLWIPGPVQLAKDFLIDAGLPLDSSGPVRLVRLLLAFGLVIVIVNGVAAMLSRASLPGSLTWLILIGVLLLPRFVFRRLRLYGD